MAWVQTRWRHLLEDSLAGGHHGTIAMVTDGGRGSDFTVPLLAVADAWEAKNKTKTHFTILTQRYPE